MFDKRELRMCLFLWGHEDYENSSPVFVKLTKKEIKQKFKWGIPDMNEKSWETPTDYGKVYFRKPDKGIWELTYSNMMIYIVFKLTRECGKNAKQFCLVGWFFFLDNIYFYGEWKWKIKITRTQRPVERSLDLNLPIWNQSSFCHILDKWPWIVCSLSLYSFFTFAK